SCLLHKLLITPLLSATKHSSSILKSSLSKPMPPSWPGRAPSTSVIPTLLELPGLHALTMDASSRWNTRTKILICSAISQMRRGSVATCALAGRDSSERQKGMLILGSFR
ncbi:hypothetical protein HDU97_008996, partial [Phlyctochytrium planicorne]